MELVVVRYFAVSTFPKLYAVRSLFRAYKQANAKHAAQLILNCAAQRVEKVFSPRCADFETFKKFQNPVD